MALIEGQATARAQSARVSMSAETGRLCAFWSEDLAAIGHVWPVSSVPNFRFETTAEWSYVTALGGMLEWPPSQYARTAGGWLIRLELAPGEYGYNFIPDEG